MSDTRVAGQFIFAEKTDDLRCGGSRLRNGFGDILRSLTGAGKINARGRTFNGTQFRVRFREKVVCVHARGQHCRKRTGGSVRLDRRGKYYKIGVDMQLSVVKKIGRLNSEFFAFRRNLADHTFYIMNTVFLDRAAVELIEVLAGSTHVDIEYVNIGVGILVANEHRVFCRVHTADF